MVNKSFMVPIQSGFDSKVLRSDRGRKEIIPSHQQKTTPQQPSPNSILTTHSRNEKTTYLSIKISCIYQRFSSAFEQLRSRSTVGGVYVAECSRMRASKSFMTFPQHPTSSAVSSHSCLLRQNHQDEGETPPITEHHTSIFPRKLLSNTKSTNKSKLRMI